MSVRLDHLVILVPDLRRAVRDYEGAGFAVTQGGNHADGLTHNAIVPFRDGTYLELVAFLDAQDTRDNVWGWRPFVASGGGLIDYCASADDLEATLRGLRGVEVEGPDEGGRTLPDGEEIRWRTARIRQRGRAVPFLIQDRTPRERRVPSGAAADHPNGASGILSVSVATSGDEVAAEVLSAFATRRDGATRMGSARLETTTSDGGEPGPRAAVLRGPDPDSDLGDLPGDLLGSSLSAR